MANWIKAVDERDLIALLPRQSLAPIKAKKEAEAASAIIQDLAGKGVLTLPRTTAKKSAKKAAPTKKSKQAKKAGGDKDAALESAGAATKQGVATDPERNLFGAVKSEFYALVCTKHKRYSKLRKKLSKNGNQATTIIVGLISAAIGGALGIGAGICAPFVALILLALVSVGTNAWCKVARG